VGSRLLAVVAVVATALGCSAEEDCTTIAFAGLKVSVVDGSGAPVCDVIVEARDGEWVEQQELSPIVCEFSGATERPGTYDVSAIREDAVLAKKSVKVEANECHVETEEVTLTVE
jgi:hypothetical protein